MSGVRDPAAADIRPFGTMTDGRAVDAVRLQRGELTVTVLTLGAILQDVRLAGAPWSLTLGSDQIAAYDHGPMAYHGAVVGPVANRIAGARAPLDGRMLRFDANEAGRTCLHGGSTGLATRVWEIADAGLHHLTLRLTLADGDGGFPGNRVCDAAFVLGSDADLTLTLSAATDAPTLMNLTNHSFWSLDGRSVRRQSSKGGGWGQGTSCGQSLRSGPAPRHCADRTGFRQRRQVGH